MFGPRVIPVTDDIFCIRRASYLTCSYLVRTPNGLVLVDAGMASDGEDIRVLLRALDEPVKAIRAILLTHWHNDHAAGAYQIQKESGAQVYYHQGDAPFLTRETARSGLRGWLSQKIPEWGLFVLFKGLLGEATPRAVAATRFVEHDETILDDFRVIATPGHTPGHLAFYYAPQKALFAGDALAVVHRRLSFMARNVTPDRPTARASMRACLDLDFDLLCPGHRIFIDRDVKERCAQMREYIDGGGKWPLLGLPPKRRGG